MIARHFLRTRAALRSPLFAVTSARPLPQAPSSRIIKRNMGGGHGHAAPQYTGFEAKVRSVLKEDWQLVLGIMGFYTSLYILSKLIFGGKKKEEAPAAAAVAVASGNDEVVSITDDKFSEWFALPGNAEKWEKSLNDEKAYA